MTATQLPTFLGIGSMRCATSWLHRVLSAHPEISTPTPKQPNFFDKQLLHHDLDWYRNQFKDEPAEEPAPVRGEISTGYCKLGRRSVQLIRDVLGDVPIIFSIREPIDRTWSQLKYELGPGRSPSDVLGPILLARASSRRIQRYNDFQRTLRIWSSVFGGDRVHVALYDDLLADPEDYLRAVLEHIGADPTWRPPNDLLLDPVLSTQPCPMPNGMQWTIARRMQPMVEELNRRLDGRLAGWIEKYEALERPDSLPLGAHRVGRGIASLASTPIYEGYEFIRSSRRRRRGRGLIEQAVAYRAAPQQLLARPVAPADDPREHRRRAA